MSALRIAVADDERDTREFLQKVLERVGHVVLGPVDNGRQLVELCLESMPDLVITDIRMPYLDGDHALREIHEVHPVPCIVLSAFGNTSEMAFETNKVPWAFLGKPFRRGDLLDAIHQLMPSETSESPS
ncbi:MAG: response regulator [Planctomycetales bacterium]|nr:response regulator [Planctomycetales bacterium]